MKKDDRIVMIVALAGVLVIAGAELTYVAGENGAIVLIAAAIAAAIFSMIRRPHPTLAFNEAQELAEAAERYMQSLGRGDRERLDSESIELRGFGVDAKLRGRRLISENVGILLVLSAFAAFLYYHHVTTAELLQKVLEATSENTYVLSLSQAEREKLQIAMPESLRKKIRVQERTP